MTESASDFVHRIASQPAAYHSAPADNVVAFEVTDDQWTELARRAARDGFASVEEYARHQTLGLDRVDRLDLP